MINKEFTEAKERLQLALESARKREDYNQIEDLIEMLRALEKVNVEKEP